MLFKQAEPLLLYASSRLYVNFFQPSFIDIL